MNSALSALGLSTLLIIGITPCTVFEGGDAPARRRILSESFSGRIAYVFRDPDRKFQPYIKLVDSTTHSMQADLNNSIEPGSYMFKAAGSLQYRYVSPSGDTTIFYQRFAGKEIR